MRAAGFGHSTPHISTRLSPELAAPSNPGRVYSATKQLEVSAEAVRTLDLALRGAFHRIRVMSMLVNIGESLDPPLT